MIASDSNDPETAGKLADLTRRRFIQGAAVTSASAVLPVAASTAAKGAQASTSASSDSAARLPNPIVPNAQASYGGAIPSFQVPKRPMGKTGLEVSIIG
ncbi:MAG TPA: hypothetical protein VHZ28_08865, partial [Terracidiphilus sp.]|nr:hypothetical protein [Terracidiphilus sp.]